MATTSKVFFRGAATTTTTTTLYTVPSATTAVVSEIVVTNTGPTAQTFTMTFNGVNFASQIAVGGNDSTVIDVKQPLAATQTIQGGASSTALNFHIAGVEIV